METTLEFGKKNNINIFININIYIYDKNKY